MSTPSNVQVYEQQEKKPLKYTNPQGAIVVNQANLLFAKMSFWNGESRVDIRKYFLVKQEDSRYPDITAKPMPGKTGLSLSLQDSQELVRCLRALLMSTPNYVKEDLRPRAELMGIVSGSSETFKCALGRSGHDGSI